MGETFDAWAREQVGKLWGDLRELASDYWGPDRANGRRSEIADLRTRVDALEGREKHYMDAKRAETCYGLKALAEHEAACGEAEEEDTAVKVAQIQAGATGKAAAWRATAALGVQILTLIGVLVAALK